MARGRKTFKHPGEFIGNPPLRKERRIKLLCEVDGCGIEIGPESITKRCRKHRRNNPNRRRGLTLRQLAEYSIIRAEELKKELPLPLPPQAAEDKDKEISVSILSGSSSSLSAPPFPADSAISLDEMMTDATKILEDYTDYASL